MGNRVFTATVLLLWASTTTWLVVAKILPPFFEGEPPSAGILQFDAPLLWRIECLDRRVGWAVSQAVEGAAGSTELHSRVLLEGIPLREMAPEWMGALVSAVGEIDLDARSRHTFDAFRHLASFETKVGVNGETAVLKMSGRLRDSQVELKIQSGQVTHEVSIPVTANAVLTGALLPESKLLQLHVGRQWQRRIVSPFHAPNAFSEMIHAEVVEEEQIMYEGRPTPCRRIEYRILSEPGIASKNTLRAVLWVGVDGTVLRQDMYLMNVRLRFDRISDPELLDFADRLLDLPTVAARSIPHRP